MTAHQQQQHGKWKKEIIGYGYPYHKPQELITDPILLIIQYLTSCLPRDIVHYFLLLYISDKKR